MPRFIFSYPDGIQGIALLVLRLSYASASLPIFLSLCRLPPCSRFAMPIAAIVALQLVTGLGTRFAASAFACATIWSVLAQQLATTLVLLALAGGAGALALLGPGAYSIDAHRFGRRVIRLDPRSPDRGSAG